MAFFKPSLVFCLFLTFLSLNCGPCHVFAKVYMVVMEDDPVISYKVNRKHIMYVFSVRITLTYLMQISLTKEFLFRRGEEAQKYKQVATTKHDSFLDSFLPIGSYKKLYSYTHLINGFALHAESAKVPSFEILKAKRGSSTYVILLFVASSDCPYRLAIYKAAYPFGGYMSDVIAAVDQAVEDGVDVISLSMAPSSVSPGPASFLNLLEVQLLLATKAGVSVVQAVGNAGPDENTVVSFSPWILSVAASTTDRKYRKSIIIGNGKSFSCGALSALADDVMVVNSTDDGYNKCGDPKIFIKALVQGKALMRYYNNNTVRDEVGNVVSFGATARILEGRHATYTGEAPVVADYSSRGPDVENSQLQPAEVLKPNVMAPGHLIWGAWSPTSDAMPEIRGESYALLSGTSMAAPHVAGVAALIKQQHPTWSPAMVMSAIMTSADATDRSGTTFLCSVPGVDDAAVLRAVGAPCPPPPPAARAGAGAAARWCSDLNAASVTVASLVGSRRVERRVTSVGAENETYAAYVRAPEGVAVRVWPAEFAIAPGATRTLRIVLNATAPGSAFSFGEVVLRGDRKHRVRIPLAVYPTSKLSP
ncbi:hypothetical protein HU200_032710 [Digitaria exilis]|uniref:Uncharacterized protein n=1 Tax=Digitaria exilis TaxID=1010633 RepID=A0A835BYT0_9POAL|nr:hypothetical protein HU200_032710 [Digitaria exilis]